MRTRRVAMVTVGLWAAVAASAQEPESKDPGKAGVLLHKRALPPPGLMAGLSFPPATIVGVPTQAQLKEAQKRSAATALGVHVKLSAGVLQRGRWSTLNNGTRIWRLALRSPGARAIRLHFTNFSLQKGSLWLYPPKKDAEAAGPYSEKGTNKDGDFWSDIVSGDTVVLEYRPERNDTNRLPFSVPELSHLAVAMDGGL